MRTQEAFHGAEILPAPPAWRVSPGFLCLLALLPLGAGLLLPLVSQHATVPGKRGAGDPFAIVLQDGRLLVCEGCRSLIAQWRLWTSPGESTRAATKAAPEVSRPSVPARKLLANTAPSAPPLPKASAVASHPGAPRYSGAMSFDDEVALVLPRYRGNFEEAGRSNGLDWRLLAAVGYQESRWNPLAVSPTGVRGLMMLTTNTASDLGVDRDDGAQSIRGAGRLLQNLYAQLPPQIHEPDRTAMALAAYNQGIGHLLDARDVVINRGGDPDRWSDVRAALPLLSDADWQKTTKYGFARGSEAVAFVDGVRQYRARLMSMMPAAVTVKDTAPRPASRPAGAGKT